ncbi:PorT family protein [Dyadobacter sp. LJ53]|uniref:porin family protein n=1 Tax=Dyadobacter chenwenxiniae TaxID=2906456 RepID=UPI001F2DFC0D|nr:porin family protein [Dyadobacter chenwenxiniae]MCF0051603.1 PorT family protein [Dyadobacter chenwenxiniae]
MKTLAVSIFLLAICGSVFAQDIKIAPVIGPSVTVQMLSRELRDLYTDGFLEDYLEDSEFSSTGKFPPSIGLQAGALLDLGFSESLSLQTGLMFTLKGLTYKIKGNYTDFDGDRQSLKAKNSLSITYLEIPAWFSYRLGDSGFKIIGGPGFGFAVGGKSKWKASGGGESESESEKVEIGTDPDFDDVKPIDLNFNIGVAKEIMLGDRPLEISAFAQPSITKWMPIAKEDSEYFTRHFTAGIRVAYFFQIK